MRSLLRETKRPQGMITEIRFQRSEIDTSQFFEFNVAMSGLMIVMHRTVKGDARMTFLLYPLPATEARP
jgi:hypothetical protein